jgi:hypothetical protein
MGAISGSAVLLSARGGDFVMSVAGQSKVLFVAGFGPIVRDNVASERLYKSTFEIPFKEEQGGYLHTDAVEGVKHFALWPLTQVAQSCFGNEHWPDELPTPQAWIEFEAESVHEATADLEAAGYRMLVSDKVEPWGQTVSRFLSPEGLLIGISFTPWMRRRKSG